MSPLACDAVRKGGALTPRKLRLHGRPRGGRGPETCALTIRSGSEAVLYSLDHRVEDVALGGGVDHGKAVDQSATAREHDLLVEDAAATLSRESEPAAARAAVVDLVIRVGMTGNVFLVGRGV